MFWLTFLILLQLTHAFNILPFNQETKPNLKYIAYQTGSTHIETVDSLSKINPKRLYKYGVVKINNSSVVFNEELAYNTMSTSYKPIYDKQRDYATILKHDKNKYYEVSYADAKLTREINDWKPIGKCVINQSTERATYSQGWQIDVASSLNFKIDFGLLITNLRPNSRSELVLTKSIGGGLSCDVEPGNPLQFALITESCGITGVKQREIKITTFGLKPGDWQEVPPFSRVNKRNVQVACFTDNRFTTCQDDL
ncbi:hypothetical protein JA1_002546 [Spathaspora sp. JA1]|nr:hypothetical protein JA1_002546 [Spathaspora sp. JA1]